jgi:hypothetical protein
VEADALNSASAQGMSQRHCQAWHIVFGAAAVMGKNACVHNIKRSRTC